jgi:hypothetical protein
MQKKSLMTESQQKQVKGKDYDTHSYEYRNDRHYDLYKIYCIINWLYYYEDIMYVFCLNFGLGTQFDKKVDGSLFL